ncbi:SusC/RagA family TonB-linked outer membrane protein [Pedobacter paludis]|nr:SusC/RagA family TonB-linked outer membrane protein [Pedobacter paludis]
MNNIHNEGRGVPTLGWPLPNQTLLKYLVAMKVFLLIIVFSLNVSAAAYSQQINLNVKQASLRKVMQSVFKQTGYAVAYPSSFLKKAKPVTVILKQATIDEALREIFKDQPFDYQVEDKVITIEEKKEKRVAVSEQQRRELAGVVTDVDGRPMINVTVTVKGQGRLVTITNERGEFSFKNAPDNGVIVLSSIGYETTQSPYDISQRGPFKILMKTLTSPLDEVQVIAYGTTSKRISTGNIGSIKAADITKQPISNPLVSMTGRIPGISVIQSTGLPGSAVTVRIQGQNSIGKGNNPFYVVDGVPFISENLRTISTVLGNTQGGDPSQPGSGNPFTYLNPADIESIEVLKDADATAIYGSRAANGAVLITTKRGKSGKTAVEVTMQSGTGKVGRYIDVLNTAQYLQMRKEAYLNDGQPYPDNNSFKDFSNYDITVWDTTRSMNWQKEILGGTARYTDVQASLSGGNAYTTFRFNAGYHKETTVFGGNYADTKGSIGMNINHRSANGKFKFLTSVSLLNDANKLPRTDITNSALTLSPNAPTLRKSDGQLNWERILLPGSTDSVSTFFNPLAEMEGINEIRSMNLIGSTNISYSIFKGLTLRSNFGYTYLGSDEVQTLPLTVALPEDRPYSQRYAQYGNSKITSWIAEPQIEYQKPIGNGVLEVLVGTSFQERHSKLQQLTGSGYTSDEVLRNYAAATDLTPGFGVVDATYKYNGVFARVNYNWAQKYILNITARRDGSSRFGRENRFHNFGAIGGAWIFSSEDFIRENFNALSFGKFRASYGTTGNDQIDDYTYLNVYNPSSSANNYQGVSSLSVAGLYNPYLQWELTKKLSLGIDLGFFKDRIIFTANFYRNRSGNQLLNYALPSISGFTSLPLNFPALVQNQGYEFSINTRNIDKGNFSWSTNISFTTSRNQLVSFPDIESSSYTSLLVGKSIDIIRHYNYAGVNPQTGLYQFYAADKSVVATPTSPRDNNFIYTGMPKFFGGIENSFSYKQIRLDIFFEFKKQLARNYDVGFGFSNGNANFNAPTSVLERWRQPGDISTIQKFSTNEIFFNAITSDRSYSDASYLKLRNVSLSYMLPAALIKKAHLDMVRIFASGQNLYTFTKYKGFDPENLTISSVPPLRLVTFGVQLGL